MVAAHKTRIAFKTSIFVAYSRATWLYARNISRRSSGGKFLKRYDGIASRGDVFSSSSCAIENVGVHLEVSSSLPFGRDRIKEVICKRGCRIWIYYLTGKSCNRGRMRSVFMAEFVIGSREGANIILFMNFWSFSGLDAKIDV